MTAIFSKRFLIAPGLLGASSTVTVPAGHVYVVKQLTVYANAALGDINAFFEDVATTAALFDGLIPGGKNGWAGFYGALVFEAGDAFLWHVTSSFGETADCFASGYDLSA